jgi:probable HAF family extracellular repeat protein
MGVNCVWGLKFLTIGYSVEDIGVLPGDNESRGIALNALPNRNQVAGTSGIDHAILWEHQMASAPVLIDLEGLSFQAAPISAALGLNNQFPSAVVGFHALNPNVPIPILWELSGRTSLPTLGGGTGQAYSVNNSMVIIGWSSNAAGEKRACRWIRGVTGWGVEDLGTLGGSNSEARRVNEVGNIVGAADDASGVSHAFRWTLLGGMQDIHSGAGSTIALGINAHDEVVGDLQVGANESAFHWSQSTGLQILAGLAGANVSFATAINDSGLIVGRSVANGPHAVIWYSDQVVRLTDQLIANPGWNLVQADSINNRGQITGFGTAPSGQSRGFLLTPIKVPVPYEFCYLDVSQWERTLPNLVTSPILSDGGGIVVSPDGRVVHVRPPRPDPLSYVGNETSTANQLRALLEDRVSRLGEQSTLTQRVSEISSQIYREIREELMSLGKQVGENWQDRQGHAEL